jgi:hypothetical protein
MNVIVALGRISEIEFEGYNFTKSPTLIGLVEEKFWFADEDWSSRKLYLPEGDFPARYPSSTPVSASLRALERHHWEINSFRYKDLA